jgi:hypothetical protein
LMTMGVKEIHEAHIHTMSFAYLDCQRIASRDGLQARAAHRPRLLMTSSYLLAVGMIDPTRFRQSHGSIKKAAVEAQKPHHKTVSQIDQ